MTGEEGTKVVGNNSSSNSSGEVVDLSVNDSATGVVVANRDVDNCSSSVTNGQSEVADISSGGSPPVTADLSKSVAAATSNTNYNFGKNLNSTSGLSDLADRDSGDFEGSSTVNFNSSLEVSNSAHTPQRRNGRTESGAFSQKDEGLAIVESPAALSDEELIGLPHNIVQHIQDSKQYIQYITKDLLVQKEENAQLKESNNSMRLQNLESSRRENVLVMRLTTKEQELQDYIATVNELKSAVAPSPGSLRSALLDPAVNLIIQKTKKEMEELKKKFEDTQNDLNAWKFTPDSNTGKRLMAKCRMLYQENEDIGKMITSGRVAKLESDFALQKSLTDEMKKSQSELDELIQELDEDVEGMQSTIYYLQQQLRESKTNMSNTSNLLTSSNNNSEEISVIVSDLCAPCRTFQHEKKQQQRNSSPGPSQKSPTVEEVEGEENSLHNKVEDNDEDERTCVNGEADLSRSDNEESEGPKRTLKSKHSKDTNIDDNDSDSRIVVQTKECEIGSEGERRTKHKFENQMETECDEETDLSYTSSPPTKRMKLPNHSLPASTTKHLNPIQVQNSNDSPILVNNISGSGFNRNGSVDH